MAQCSDPNFYHSQAMLPAQCRIPFDMLFDERTGAVNYSYIRPYITPNHPAYKPGAPLPASFVLRRPRRTRTTFSETQLTELEQCFGDNRYLSPTRLSELSSKLSLGTAQVKIWFKNRRRRMKILEEKQKASTNTDDTNTTEQKLKYTTAVTTPPAILTPSPTPTSTPNNPMEVYHKNTFYNLLPYSQQLFPGYQSSSYFQCPPVQQLDFCRDVKRELDYNFNYQSSITPEPILDFNKNSWKFNNGPITEPLTPKTDDSSNLEPPQEIELPKHQIPTQFEEYNIQCEKAGCPTQGFSNLNTPYNLQFGY